MHISTVNISPHMIDSASNTSTTNIMSHVFFRLVYSELTFTYHKGQLGRRNGVSPNSFAFLFCILCEVFTLALLLNVANLNIYLLMKEKKNKKALYRRKLGFFRVSETQYLTHTYGLD